MAAITGPLVQENALQKIYRRQKAAILGISAMLSFFLLWEFAGRVELVDPLFMSIPTKVIQTGFTMFVKGEIWPHISISGQEFLAGYVASVIVGLIAGIVLGRFKRLDYMAAPFVDALYATPLIVFLPLFIIWVGIGIGSKIIIVFLGSLFPVLMNVYQGVRTTDPRFLEAARSYGARERDIFFKVVVKAAIPYIIAGLRLGIGRALIMMIVAEFYVSTAGLGYLLAIAGSTFQTAKLWVVVAMIAGFGVITNQVIAGYQRRIAPWLYERQQE